MRFPVPIARAPDPISDDDPIHRPVLGLARHRFRGRVLPAARCWSTAGWGPSCSAAAYPQRACLEELVTTHPEMVGAAHREYLEAGAELIETLSFGANRQRLAAWGLEGQAGASTGVRRSSPARLARSAAATRWSAVRSGRWFAGPRRDGLAGGGRRGRRSASRSRACSRAGRT